MMKKTIMTILAAVTVSLTIAAQGVNFIEGKPLADVLAQAKNEGKLVFVDCYTQWCGPCKMMATKEFVKPEAGEYFNAKFVNMKIDMEAGEGPEVGKKYDVSAYPTFLILETDGSLRGRCVGSAGIGDFIKKVENVLSNEKGLTWYQKKFKEGERGEQFLKEYTAILNENYMRDELKDVAKALLAGKTGAQIAADKGLFKAFSDGGFNPFDDLFLTVYKERAAVIANQGEQAAKQMDGMWAQYAMACMKFSGHDYLGFDEAKFEDYKQKMAAYGVPDIDKIVDNTLHTKAQYGKDYATLYQYVQKAMKQNVADINDRTLLADMDQLVKNYKDNKKAIKTIVKFAKQRIATLQKKDTTGERQFELDGKKTTLTEYMIEQYQDILAEAAKK